MSGALAERVFAHKIEAVGFTDVVVHERRAFSLEDAVRYPLFTADLVELMRRLIPVERQSEIATAVTLTAVRP